MRIDLYTRCWNDAHMLGFFFRHYDPVVQRYVIFDDGSTDGAYEFLRSHPKVKLRAMPPRSDPESRVASGLAVLESCWHASRGRADWVIVTDIDEHIHHADDLASYLRACKARGVTIIPALGYEMIADKFPRDDLLLSRALTMGAPCSGMNKLNIFSPDDIVATNFAIGRHSAEPTGNVVAPARDELLLLHYRHLDFERTLARHALARARQRPKDLAEGWGFQYAWTRQQFAQHWRDLAARAIDTASPELRPWDTHAGERWWDRYRLPE
jgi:Glycosyl transferase family 2